MGSSNAAHLKCFARTYGFKGSITALSVAVSYTHLDVYKRQSQLRKLDENTFLSVFEGVPMFNINKSELMRGVHLFDLLTGNTSIFPSRGELKRTIKGNGLSINQEKITDEDLIVNREFLIGEKYILCLLYTSIPFSKIFLEIAIAAEKPVAYL